MYFSNASDQLNIFDNPINYFDTTGNTYNEA